MTIVFVYNQKGGLVSCVCFTVSLKPLAGYSGQKRASAATSDGKPTDLGGLGIDLVRSADTRGGDAPEAGDRVDLPASRAHLSVTVL
jgi:hypothetical protein